MSGNKAERSGAIVKLVVWSVVLVMLEGILAIALSLETFNIFSVSGISVLRGELYDDPESYNIGEASYSNIKNLSIHWSAGSVDIVVYDGEEIRLEENGAIGDEDDKMRSRAFGDTLEIRYVKSGYRWFENVKKKELKIYIPWSVAQELGTIEMFTGSADLHVGEPGNESIACKKLDIDCVSGKINVNMVSAGNFDFDGVSASLTVPGDFGNIVADTVSGNIIFEGEVVDMDVSGVSSDVNIDTGVMPSNVNVDTVSGNIKLSFLAPSDGKGFDAELDSVSGEMRFNSSAVSKKYEYEDKSSKMRFNTVSGNVDIVTK